jgi:hypothetical protein
LTQGQGQAFLAITSMRVRGHGDFHSVAVVTSSQARPGWEIGIENCIRGLQMRGNTIIQRA